MHPDEITLCVKIFEMLKTREAFNMFWNNTYDIVNSDIIHPITFEVINSKLDKKCYSTINEFISDVNLCIENGKAGYPAGSIRNSAAFQLQHYFEEILRDVNPFGGPIAMPLQLVIKDYLDTNRFILKNSSTKITNPEQITPGSLLFEQKSINNDTESLLRDIKLLNSTSLAAEFATFVRKLQPEAIIINEEVVFNISLITKENVPLLRRFVTALLKKGALGNIDVYSRPFGQKISPLEIHERGFPLITRINTY